MGQLALERARTPAISDQQAGLEFVKTRKLYPDQAKEDGQLEVEKHGQASLHRAGARG